MLHLECPRFVSRVNPPIMVPSEPSNRLVTNPSLEFQYSAKLLHNPP